MLLLPSVVVAILLLITTTTQQTEDQWLTTEPAPPGASGLKAVEFGSSSTRSPPALDVEVTDDQHRSSTTVPCLHDQCTTESFDVGRIVGGVETGVNAFPWMAGLVYSNKSVKRPFCGAVLISGNSLLTAAHCIDGKRSGEVLVSLGEHNVEDNRPPILFNIRQMTAHSDYNGKTYVNDIALIKIDGNVPNMATICLPANENSEDSGNFIVLGWGTTSEGGKGSPFLRQASVQLIPRSECLKSYPDRITVRMICAGHPAGGRDSCRGDSGGPLVSSRRQLIGVVSWGIGCGRKRYPGVYTRISSFLSWIANYSTYTPCPI